MAIYDEISAIILSGGKSTRMGEDKCDLKFGGRTLLDIQFDKMKKIGISDVVAAGYRGNKSSISNLKVVNDPIMKGPISGIFLGLSAIENNKAFVISVDVPLVKEDIIKKVIDFSFSSNKEFVILRHNGIIEPLISVFDKKLLDRIKMILEGDKYSVMKLADVSSYGYIDINDDEKYFMNINNKEDYNRLLNLSIEEV